jgi:hypothetical protein
MQTQPNQTTDKKFQALEESKNIDDKKCKISIFDNEQLETEAMQFLQSQNFTDKEYANRNKIKKGPKIKSWNTPENKNMLQQLFVSIPHEQELPSVNHSEGENECSATVIDLDAENEECNIEKKKKHIKRMTSLERQKIISESQMIKISDSDTIEITSPDQFISDLNQSIPHPDQPTPIIDSQSSFLNPTPNPRKNKLSSPSFHSTASSSLSIHSTPKSLSLNSLLSSPSLPSLPPPSQIPPDTIHLSTCLQKILDVPSPLPRLSLIQHFRNFCLTTGLLDDQDPQWVVVGRHGGLREILG